MRACVREEHGERWGVCGGVREEWRMLELPESFVQGHPWGIACTFFILIFFLIKHAEKKKSKLAARVFFLSSVFVVHLSLHGRSVYFAQENEGPKRHCSACKAFMEGTRGREGEELPSLLKQS